MRRRLLASTLGVVVFAVVLLGLPLGFVGSRLIHDEARQRLLDNAQRIAAELDERDAALTPGLLAQLAPGDRRIRVRQDHGRVLSAGPRLTGRVLSVTVTARGGTVQVATSSESIDRRAGSAWLLVLGLIVLSTGGAVVLATVQARRLGAPLEELAVTAGRLGSGDTRPHPRRYGVPEIDRVAAVLDRSAGRLGDLLRRQRDFATDASHQLRTPLTALSIRLEEIALTDDLRVVREEAAAALDQAERLAGVVDALLARARARDRQAEPTTLVDVVALLRQQQREWEPAYRRAGRELTLEMPASVQAAATPGGLTQVVATLLENSLQHGAGPVRVRARRTAEHVVVEVADDGPGIDAPLVPRVFERAVSGNAGTGLGLSLARALVESDGGRLELLRARPPVFAVFLPTAVAPVELPTAAGLPS